MFISKNILHGVLRQHRENAVTAPHSAQRKHAFSGETKQMSKSKKLTPRKRGTLELLHNILGHRSTISLMPRYTANVWKNIELSIDPVPFRKSCQIFLMNKKAGSKNPLKPKSYFKCGFMNIIPETALKSLTSETTFSNYILFVDAYLKLKTLRYGNNYY